MIPLHLLYFVMLMDNVAILALVLAWLPMHSGGTQNLPGNLNRRPTTVTANGVRCHGRPAALELDVQDQREGTGVRGERMRRGLFRRLEQEPGTDRG